MDSILFGQKKGFAIELADFNRSRLKGKLRWWFEGKPYGDLTRSDDLQDACDSFNTLLRSKDELYDEAFAAMTHVEMFSHCLLLDARNDPAPGLYDRMQKMRETYSLWFGEQLDNVAHVIYYRGGSYHFLLSHNKNKGFDGNYLRNLVYHQVPVAEVETAVQAFLLHFA